MFKKKFFKKILFSIVLVTAISIGGYIYLDKTRPGLVLGMEELKEKISESLPQANEIAEKLPLKKMPAFEGVNSNSIKKAVTTTSEQLETLSEKANEVKDKLADVIAEVKEDETTPLHEKAFEYGQYLYCQQVVKDYEAE